MSTDLINGLFEIVGGCFHLLSVKAILKDKQIKGFSPLPTIFFSAWGLWNLIFYPVNGHWFSFIGGIFLVSVNLWYLYLIHKYWKNGDDNA